MENNKFLPSDLMSSSPNRLTEAPRRLIPKVIHYCWFGPKPLSRTVRKCIKTWHKHLSDYEFCFWNEQTCREYAAAHELPNPMEHPFVKGAYEAKKYAFVADYVRFWALYYCGGVYLDTDMYVVRNFDDLLGSTFFSAWETMESTNNLTQDRIVSCGIIGASLENPSVLQMLNKYDTFLFDTNNMGYFIVTRIVTPIILDDLNNKIYSFDYFYPLPYQERFTCRKMRYNTENTYAVHLWDISWGKWHAKAKDTIIYLVKKVYKKK